ncbi:MAG: hypothetical protein ABEJ26_14050 [Halosimplex sp.]
MTGGATGERRVRDRVDEVRERELETALAKLDARGDVSAADREAVEALAERLVERLAAPGGRGRNDDAAAVGSRASSSESIEEDSERAVATAVSLFG